MADQPRAADAWTERYRIHNVRGSDGPCECDDCRNELALNVRIENLIASYNAKVDFAAETLRFERANAQVLDQIRQKQDAAEALGVVEEVLVAHCQHATDDNADLRSALLELRIVRSLLDLRMQKP